MRFAATEKLIISLAKMLWVLLCQTPAVQERVGVPATRTRGLLPESFLECGITHINLSSGRNLKYLVG